MRITHLWLVKCTSLYIQNVPKREIWYCNQFQCTEGIHQFIVRTVYFAFNQNPPNEYVPLSQPYLWLKIECIHSFSVHMWNWVLNYWWCASRNKSREIVSHYIYYLIIDLCLFRLANQIWCWFLLFSLTHSLSIQPNKTTLSFVEVHI